MDQTLSPVEMAMLLQVEQKRRWRAGDPVRVEVFFQEYPILKADEEAAVDAPRCGKL